MMAGELDTNQVKVTVADSLYNMQVIHARLEYISEILDILSAAAADKQS
jgi:hypothetical protein